MLRPAWSETAVTAKRAERSAGISRMKCCRGGTGLLAPALAAPVSQSAVATAKVFTRPATCST